MKKNELLKQGNYLTVIKPLAHKIGLDETIILMELVGMEEYKEQKHLMFEELMKEKNQKINPNKVKFYLDDRAFECTSTELELATTIKKKKQVNILKKMTELNLLRTEQRGIPAKRFIILNHDEIESTLNKAVTGYQSFKDQFFADKKEKTLKQMEKRKQKKSDDSLLSQKGTTDNTNYSSSENGENPQSNQLSQKGTTSNPDSGQQVVPNEDTLNNINNLIISSNNNIKTNQPLLVELENSNLPPNIIRTLKDRVGRLVSDNIKVIDIENHFNAVKDIYPSNEYAFVLGNLLDKAEDTIKNISSLMNRWLQNNRNFNQEVSEPKSKKTIRQEIIPESFHNNSTKEKSISELTDSELHSTLLKYEDVAERIPQNKSVHEKIAEIKAEIERRQEKFRQTV